MNVAESNSERITRIPVVDFFMLLLYWFKHHDFFPTERRKVLSLSSSQVSKLISARQFVLLQITTDDTFLKDDNSIEKKRNRLNMANYEILLSES